MTQNLLTLIVITICSGILLIGSIVAERNPEIITGFEKHTQDKAWLKRFKHLMLGSSLTTLVLGIISVMIGNVWLLVCSLIAPSIAVVIFVLGSKQWDTIQKRNNINTKVIAVTMSLLVVIIAPMAYMYISDLDVTFDKNRISINGIYGEDIQYDEINEVELLPSAPNTRLRTNGFSLGDTKQGYFATDKGNVKLLINSSGRCIHISTKNNRHYYVNSKDLNTTVSIYKRLKTACKKN